MSVTARPCVSLLCACFALGGCSTMHVKRAAYQMLRQEDCRLNQLESFCRRNFANEYHEYERLRRTFIRESAEDAWRASGRDAAVNAVVADAGATIAPLLAAGPAIRTAPDDPARATEDASGRRDRDGGAPADGVPGW